MRTRTEVLDDILQAMRSNMLALFADPEPPDQRQMTRVVKQGMVAVMSSGKVCNHDLLSLAQAIIHLTLEMEVDATKAGEARAN